MVYKHFSAAEAQGGENDDCWQQLQSSIAANNGGKHISHACIIGKDRMDKPDGPVQLPLRGLFAQRSLACVMKGSLGRGDAGVSMCMHVCGGVDQ